MGKVKIYLVEKDGNLRTFEAVERTKEEEFRYYKYKFLSSGTMLQEYKKPKNKELFYWTGKDGEFLTIFPEKAIKRIKEIKKQFLKEMNKNIKKIAREKRYLKGRF